MFVILKKKLAFACDFARVNKGFSKIVANARFRSISLYQNSTLSVQQFGRESVIKKQKLSLIKLAKISTKYFDFDYTIHQVRL